MWELDAKFSAPRILVLLANMVCENFFLWSGRSLVRLPDSKLSLLNITKWYKSPYQIIAIIFIVLVPCIINDDCPPHQLCDRLSYTCRDICSDNSCGPNAVCVPANNDYQCSCRPGYRAEVSPQAGCIPVETCDSNPCHSSARCTNTPQSYTCSCPRGKIGDPYGTGCKSQSQNNHITKNFILLPWSTLKGWKNKNLSTHHVLKLLQAFL